MAIYIDWLCRHGWRLRGRTILSCHLFPEGPATEALEELHTFARRIGLKRSWFQAAPTGRMAGSVPHYDLTAGKRAQAVAAGAIELTRKTLPPLLSRLRPYGPYGRQKGRR